MFLTYIHSSRVTNSEALQGNVNLCSDSYIQCLLIIYTWVSNKHLRLHMTQTESFIFPTKCVASSVLQFPTSINDIVHLPSCLSQKPRNWPWFLSFPHLVHPTHQHPSHQQGLMALFPIFIPYLYSLFTVSTVISNYHYLLSGFFSVVTGFLISNLGS